jgi:hypothetical protein
LSPQVEVAREDPSLVYGCMQPKDKEKGLA